MKKIYWTYHSADPMNDIRRAASRWTACSLKVSLETMRTKEPWEPYCFTIRGFTSVHPAEARAAGQNMELGSSDQFVLALVDRQDLQLEELLVPEPIGLALHRFDLIVRPLHGAGRDRHVVVSQQPTAVRRQRLGHLWQHLDPRRLRTLDPAIEESGRELLR